jgi:hypothetical protein
MLPEMLLTALLFLCVAVAIHRLAKPSKSRRADSATGKQQKKTAPSAKRARSDTELHQPR